MSGCISVKGYGLDAAGPLRKRDDKTVGEIDTFKINCREYALHQVLIFKNHLTTSHKTPEQ